MPLIPLQGLSSTIIQFMNQKSSFYLSLVNKVSNCVSLSNYAYKRIMLSRKIARAENLIKQMLSGTAYSEMHIISQFLLFCNVFSLVLY